MFVRLLEPFTQILIIHASFNGYVWKS